MMELKTVLTEYLAKTLGKPSDSISALLFKKADDGTLTDEISKTALADLETAHAEHIKSAPGDDLKAEFDKGHKQGSFEALAKAEDAIRKKYQVDGKKLDDIITAAISNAAAAAGSDDKVLIHPAYLNLKSESEARAEAIKTEYEAKISEIETRAKKQEAFSAAVPIIEQAMSEAGVVLPKNPAAASTIKKAFMAQFNDFLFENADGKTFLKSVDGKLVKDQHGHPVSLDAHTKQLAAAWFDIEKQPARGSAGNEPGGIPPPTKWTADTIPKSMEDFEKIYYTLDAPGRTELTKAYEANQKAG